jgi:hypothetical protein
MNGHRANPTHNSNPPRHPPPPFTLDVQLRLLFLPLYPPPRIRRFHPRLLYMPLEECRGHGFIGLGHPVCRGVSFVCSAGRTRGGRVRRGQGHIWESVVLCTWTVFVCPRWALKTGSRRQQRWDMQRALRRSGSKAYSTEVRFRVRYATVPRARVDNEDDAGVVGGRDGPRSGVGGRAGVGL